MSASDRKASGCLLGLAYGDALAAPGEFLPAEAIIRRYGEEGPDRPSARVTDDTQMALAVAEALAVAPKPLEPISFEHELRERLLVWSENLDDDRAAAATC